MALTRKSTHPKRKTSPGISGRAEQLVSKMEKYSVSLLLFASTIFFNFYYVKRNKMFC